jgi:hypothetical protein
MVKKKPRKPYKKSVRQFPLRMTARGWVIFYEVIRVTGLKNNVAMNQAMRLYVEKNGVRDGLDLEILESQDHIAKGVHWGYMAARKIKDITKRDMTVTLEWAIDQYAREEVAKKYPNFDHSVLDAG